MIPIKLKPGDIVRVRLAGDVYKVEVVKVNPKTFLAKMTQTKTCYRKVRKSDLKQRMLFDTGVEDTKGFVEVPFTVTKERIIKIPKGKIVSVNEVETEPAGRYRDKNANVDTIDKVELTKSTKSTTSAIDELLASVGNNTRAQT